MASSEFSHVLDVSVQDGVADNVRDVINTDSKLATIVVAPGEHLAVLVYRERMRIATAHLLYQFILQRDRQPRLKHFEGRVRSHLFVRDEVFETELTILVRSPRVKLS